MWSMVLRTAFMYAFILVVMRLMGKREIGKLSVLDLIVSFMIADISAMVIEQANQTLMQAIIPIATLMIFQILMSILMLKSKKWRSLVEGEPILVIKNGKILDKAMAKARYNLDDLLMQLREKNIPDVADVEFAFLETSGKLSIFPKAEKTPATKADTKPKQDRLKPFEMPRVIIMDGKVQENVLHEIGQTRFWLKNQIHKRGFKDFKEIFYASIDDKGKLFIDPKDKKDGQD
jgi:uncharacterized membrane protein YcaP (DUF421 family)